MSVSPVPSDSSDDNLCKLIAADGTIFECSLKAVRRAKTIHNLIEDLGLDPEESETWEPISLKSVEKDALELVIKYLEHHKNEPEFPDEELDMRKEIGEWDENLLAVPQELLHQLIMAANFLHVYSLLDVATQKVANMVTGRSVQEMRHIFNIVNDFTPEEQEEVNRENAWCTF